MSESSEKCPAQRTFSHSNTRTSHCRKWSWSVDQLIHELIVTGDNQKPFLITNTAPVLSLSLQTYVVNPCFCWQNHAGVAKKAGSVSSEGCHPEPCPPPPDPQRPYTVQWDRGVGEGLSDRNPTQSRRMVAPTDHGSVAHWCAGGGKELFVTFHKGLQS